MMNDPAKAKEYFAAKLAFTTGPIELERMMTSGEITVVDVRAEKDFKKGHIPGSANLPRERWHTLKGLAKDKLNVLVCYSQVCHLAATAAVEFADKGFSVMELEGGFKGWKEHNLPVVADEPTLQELREQIDKALAELAAIRDDLRVRIHLASLDAKAKWNELEGRLLNLQKQIGDATESGLHKLRDAIVELKNAFRSLHDSLSR